MGLSSSWGAGAAGKSPSTPHREGSNAGPGLLAPCHRRMLLGQLRLAWAHPQAIVVGGCSVQHVAPRCLTSLVRPHQPHPPELGAKAPVRGRRGSRSVFAYRGYTLPQPNHQQMSTGAPPACSLIYGSRSREGKVRGSRGGSSKHGHYTCKYRALQFPSAFPPSSPVYFPTANEPGVILHASGCNGLGGGQGSSCHPAPAVGASSAGCLCPCACPAGPARAPGAVCRQDRCPHLPAPRGNPRARGLARGHALRLGWRTKPVLTSPPT